MFLSIHAKDVLIEDKEVNLLQAPSGVTSISFEDLQKRIKITKFDTYSSVLGNNVSQDGKIRIREDLNLYTDKITMITSNGITSYTMAVEQNSKQRATFQNVTFVDRAGVIETYLLTYKASKDWAVKLRKDKKAPFEGYFSFSKLENKTSKSSGNKVLDEGCETFTYYVAVAYQCEGYNGGQYHWPWENCPYAGQNNGPGYEFSTRSLTVCGGGSGGTWVSGLTEGTSGGGSNGGSVPTYPTLPLNYNPDCNYGYSVAGKATISGASTSADDDGDCAYDNPNPPGLIANINKLSGILGLSWAEQELLHNKDALQGQTFTLDFLAYLNINGVPAENIDFVNSMFDYSAQNPDYTSSEFVNQFLNPDPGLDGEENSFNPNFWDDPNLYVPIQSLPSYNDFYNAFPKNKTSAQVYELVGGSLYTSHLADPTNYSNGCAIRVSRALLYSGITIPVYYDPSTGKQVTQKGADDKNYFLRAADLNAWLKKTFGAPTHQYTKAEGGTLGKNFPSLMKDKKGIFSMISDRPKWSSGHADVWNGKTCDPGSGCHFDGPILRIDLWVLQ